MNEIAKETTMYEAVPVVAELNRVAGFDPLKFARRVPLPGKQGTQLKLDVKYKKLWFRLKYPQGRLKVTPLRITEQIAIFEAKVYFDKKDSDPVSSYISTQSKQGTPGGLYIEYAQRMATEQALDDAGFGLQLVNTPSIQTQTPSAATEFAAPPVVEQKADEMASGEPPVPSSIPAAAPATVDEPAETPITHAQAVESVQKSVEQPTAPIETAEAAPGINDQQTPSEAAMDLPSEDEPQPVEAAGEDEPAETARYTRDMPVDEICALMTLEEARDIIVDAGTCKGWPLSQVAERRRASLRYYTEGYKGDNNILRAGAKLLLESLGEMDIAS